MFNTKEVPVPNFSSYPIIVVVHSSSLPETIIPRRIYIYVGLYYVRINVFIISLFITDLYTILKSYNLLVKYLLTVKNYGSYVEVSLFWYY